MLQFHSASVRTANPQRAMLECLEGALGVADPACDLLIINASIGHDLATLSAQVGRPGRVEGAAGSLYVEVPVSLYGRYATGERYLKGGKVQLRRVNDVPGSTAEQRAWRISGFDPDLELGPDPVSASPPTR